MEELLNIEDLTMEAQDPKGQWRTILNNASLTVVPGEVVALIGESGAGKSTLALAALGYARTGTRFLRGTIKLSSSTLNSMTVTEKRAVRGREVAYVAQSAAVALNPAIRLRHQIREGLYLHGSMDKHDADARIFSLLRELYFTAPAEIAERYPAQLSGGQQQRAMIAMAMICRPRLLVLDEPTTALDVTTQIEVLKAIKNVIYEHHTAAVYVSHDLAVVSQIATRIVVLRNGEIVEQGQVEDILEKPQHDYTRALVGAAKRPATVRSRELPPRSLEPLLVVESVSARFGRRGLGFAKPSPDVLSDVSFVLHLGETLAVVGESGSGKSTLIRVIAGLHPPFKGTVEIAKRQLARSARQRTKQDLRRIQIVFQSPEQALNPKMTVRLALDQVLKLYHDMPKAQRRSRTSELLELVDLHSGLAEKLPHQLSGGQRQRVAIARAFAAEPSVVLCDEFLSALDTIVAQRITALMAKLKSERSVSYVFVSHDLATVSDIADRVAIMLKGKIVEVGPVKDIFNDAQHPYTRLLIRSIPQMQRGWLSGAGRINSDSSENSLIASKGTCEFLNRCPFAVGGLCDQIPPPVQEQGSGHEWLCHRNDARSNSSMH